MPHLLNNVVKVKASRVPHVIQLWLREVKAISHKKYFSLQQIIFVSVKLNGDH